MRTLLQSKEKAYQELQDKVFSVYPKENIVFALAELLSELQLVNEIDKEQLELAVDSVLDKTETYCVLLTLLELEDKVAEDPSWSGAMSDKNYNLHRTVALNICNMYGAGATSFFGYIDIKFRSFFPFHKQRSFLSKGVSAIIASAATVIVSDEEEEKKDYTSRNLHLLSERGIKLEHLSQLVFDLQSPYNPKLTYDVCEHHVLQVLRKEQVYHTIEFSCKVDKGVEDNIFGNQFQEIVSKDEGKYGVDESVNTNITLLYGMIAWATFGYLDKLKPGIIGELDSDCGAGSCNTMVDDTVCAIVAAACGRLAHNTDSNRNKDEEYA